MTRSTTPRRRIYASYYVLAIEDKPRRFLGRGDRFGELDKALKFNAPGDVRDYLRQRPELTVGETLIMLAQEGEQETTPGRWTPYRQAIHPDPTTGETP